MRTHLRRTTSRLAHRNEPIGQCLPTSHRHPCRKPGIRGAKIPGIGTPLMGVQGASSPDGSGVPPEIFILAACSGKYEKENFLKQRETKFYANISPDTGPGLPA